MARDGIQHPCFHPACAGLLAATVLTALCAFGGPPPWTVAPDFQINVEQEGLRLPVNIAFVPNPGPNPDSPLYYVAEMYGSIQVVRRNGVRSTFATGLLDYNPTGPIPGAGEQGLIGLAIDPLFGNGTNNHLYVTMLWDNGAPPGSNVHYPVIQRLGSADGGLTMSSRTVLRNMQPETQGARRHIANVSFGPDGKLYVHMGDGFDDSTALNLNQYRGKVLRMNRDGTPVAIGDPAGANPFYNAADGITSRDYVYASGFRNPFGGAWRHADGRHYLTDRGNNLDRIVRLTAGMSYGWMGSDAALVSSASVVWNPTVGASNIAVIQPGTFGGSGFPPSYGDRAYVAQAGQMYAAGAGLKCIAEFPDLTTLNQFGQLAVPPRIVAQYSGTGRATVMALAAGPDGLYFSDFFEDSGAGGPTAVGARILRLRYRPPTLLGDMDCNGIVSVTDIAGFVLALTNPTAYADQYPDCDIDNGDINGNGVVSVTDIAQFVALLTGG